MQNEDSIQINRRFFQALRLLKSRRMIRGIKTFTDRYNINRWNMITCEKEPHRDLLKLAWLTYIVRDYGVSARWLILGEGGIFDHDSDGQTPQEASKTPQGSGKRNAAPDTFPDPSESVKTG